MNAIPSWLLTDERGGTMLSGRTRRLWGRSVTHRESGPVIVGYACESPHLPFLLDPVHDRVGATARLWLSEVPAPRHLDAHRIQAATWTTWDEWERPIWVSGAADTRVRLRFALLAAAEAYPHAIIRGRLRSVPLTDLRAAAIQTQKLCDEAIALVGRVPQAVSMAATAIKMAADRESGRPSLVDLPARRYPVHAWYAAMAATCACANDLSPRADAAVRQECGLMNLHDATVAAGAV